ncbi:trimeric LpxA-like protein [Xylogone sp. PMI_703]|nr:trimeric LpxA-like protein [Xylogone sp. PMI_703]
MSSSKRSSILPPGPKAPTSFAPSLVIADLASLTGTHLITLGAKSVVNPRTRLNSTHGPITVGSNCILSEKSLIGLQSAPSPDQEQGVVIGDYVIVEFGATVEAKKIGDGSLIEINAKVGKGAVLGKHCKIGPLCEIAEGEVLPDYTVVYGNGLRRIDNSGIEELKLKMISQHTAVMKKLIPTNPGKFQ